MKKALPIALAAAALSVAAPSYAATVVVDGATGSDFDTTNVNGDTTADPDYTDTFTDGSALSVVVNPSAGDFNRTLVFTLSDLISGAFAQFDLSFRPSSGYTFDHYTLTGGSYVNFDLFTLIGTSGGLFLDNGTYTVNLKGNNAGTFGSVTGDISLQAVPEPATWMMLLLGFFGVGLALRRQKSADEAQLTFMKAA